MLSNLKNKIRQFLFLLISLWIILGPQGLALRVAHAQTVIQPPTKPIVRAVLFWSDTCGNCQYVLDEVLPSLQAKYGDQLDIHLIQLATAEDVDQLYQIAVDLNIAKDLVAVPFLVIGEQVLIGSDRIEAKLPALIEEYLTPGGVEYPSLDSLAGVLPATESETGICAPATPCPAVTSPAKAVNAPVAVAQVSESQSTTAPPAAQPKSNGFTLAVGIMIGMAAALVYVAVVFVRGAAEDKPSERRSWQDLAIPVIALIGLGVAGYLSYIEIQRATAICGPVGDCNAVQSSPYSRLFGVLPVGIIGMAGYVTILAAWLWGRFREDRLAEVAPLAIFGMAVFGTLFSLYLTYLEPFVIKAVCIWCLTSAVLITLLMLFSLKPAVWAMEIFQGESEA